MLPAPDIGDHDLMTRVCSGDEDAFTFVFRRWQAPLFRFALHMCGSRTVAEDAIQETFMTLIRQTAKFDPERGALGSFLYGIARNQVLKRLERERPYTALAPGWEDVQESRAESRVFLNAAANSNDPSRNEAIEMVRQAVLTLPPDYREVVALCDLEEMSYDQAAAVLGCAAGTVASRLHRGRTLLAVKLRSAREPRIRKSSPVVVLGAPSTRITEKNFVSPEAAAPRAQKAPK